MSGTKQISLAVPDVLYEESKEYTKEYGYRNLQELLLDLLRGRVMSENIERYKKIELEMRGSGRKLTQAEAVKRLKKL